MAPAGLLGPKPGERVLDLCAAPGGKSTQLGDMLRGEGLLVANEINPKRAKILSRNMERMGIPNALVLNMHPRDLEGRFPEFFDKILVDAPCSGEGMFRKDEAVVTDWSQEIVEMCAGRQSEILDSAAKMLRPGGLLCYSTCTFAPEEDEQAVEAFLLRHPEFAPEEVSAPWFVSSGKGMYRMWPHKLLGEGHFAATLRKLEGEETEVTCQSGEKLPATWQNFAKDTCIQLPRGNATTFGNRLFWMPEGTPSLKGLRVLRPGLELGEQKKDRLEPAHALALWLKDCANTVSYPADSQQMKQYMHGDVLPTEKKGWCLVMTDNYSIGWGKGDGKQLKNHYPKGLRR